MPPAAYVNDVAKALRNQGMSNARARYTLTIDELAAATKNGDSALALVKYPMKGADGIVKEMGHYVTVDGITERFSEATREYLKVVAIRDPHGTQYFMPVVDFVKKFTGQGVLTNKLP